MYKEDLALNNLKWLICLKPNQPNFMLVQVDLRPKSLVGWVRSKCVFLFQCRGRSTSLHVSKIQIP